MANTPAMPEVIDPGTFRSWVSAYIRSRGSVEAAWETFEKAVLNGQPITDKDGDLVGYKPDAAMWRIYWSYVIGTPRRMSADVSHVKDREFPALNSLDECATAANLVLEKQISGVLDAEDAAAMRESIKLAISAHSAKKDATLADELAGAMAKPLYLEASATREEKLAAVAARLDENGEEDLGGE